MDRLNTFQESASALVPKRRLGRKRISKENDEEEDGDNDKNYTSKNLNAERRRREKLHNRLLELRSHVPVITSMNKASIVVDAITYIQELQMKVESLSEKLHQMEAPEVEEHMEVKPEETDFQEEMKKHGIQEDVEVSKIGESKYWLKIITEKKTWIFTKLMEVMNFMGFEIIDICLTTSHGAILVSSSVHGVHEGSVDVEQIKKFLMESMRNP